MTRKADGKALGRKDEAKYEGESCTLGWEQCQGGMTCCSKIKHNSFEEWTTYDGHLQIYKDPHCFECCLDENCHEPTEKCW